MVAPLFLTSWASQLTFSALAFPYKHERSKQEFLLFFVDAIPSQVKTPNL
jgi:hypothetical protein